MSSGVVRNGFISGDEEQDAQVETSLSMGPREVHKKDIDLKR